MENKIYFVSFIISSFFLKIWVDLNVLFKENWDYKKIVNYLCLTYSRNVY